MIGPKRLTLATLVITAISFLFVITQHQVKGTLYDISLAIMGSAFLGFVMSLIDYFAERRRAMERFYFEGERCLAIFNTVDPIHIDVPRKLLHDYFLEEHSNNLRKGTGNNELRNAKCALIRWYKDNDPDDWSDEDSDNDIFLAKVDNYHIVYEKAMEAFVKISSMDVSPLDFAYGDLDFIVGNKSIRERAFNDIYEEIRTIRAYIKERAYHFDLYFKDNGNFPVCTSLVDEIMNQLFDVEFIEDDSFQTINYYQKQSYDIDKALEEFKCKIYGTKMRDFPPLKPIRTIFGSVTSKKN